MSLCLVGDRYCFHSLSPRWLEQGLLFVFSLSLSLLSIFFSRVCRGSQPLCSEPRPYVPLVLRNGGLEGSSAGQTWMILPHPHQGLSLPVGPHTQKENVVLLVSCPQPTQEGSRTPKLWFLNHSEGAAEAVLSNLKADYFFFLAWLDGYFSSSLWTAACLHSCLRKNDQSLALQAGFLQTPRKLRGVSGDHSTWRTGVEPALLSAADVIWVGVNLWGWQMQKKEKKKLKTLLVK